MPNTKQAKSLQTKSSPSDVKAMEFIRNGNRTIGICPHCALKIVSVEETGLTFSLQHYDFAAKRRVEHEIEVTWKELNSLQPRQNSASANKAQSTV